MMRPLRIAAIVLAGAVLLAMGRSLSNGFVYDDIAAIVNNTRITDPSQWHTIPLAPYWLGTLWRPVTVAGFAIQWWLGHGAPWIFHAVSLAGYFAIGLMLYRLSRTLQIPPLAAGIAACCFIVHPVHVEVVANVVGQSELWVTFAMLTATALYVRARADGREGAILLPLLALVVIGIASKEQGFVIPFILAGAEWLVVPHARPEHRRSMRLLVMVLVVSITLFLLRGTLLNSMKGETSATALQNLGVADRFATFLAVVPEYARLLVWPLHLQADYGPPGIPIGLPFTVRHALGAVIVLAVLVGFFRARRRAPVVAFGLWWAMVSLAPLTNILTASGVVMSERALFVPSAGVAIALGGLLAVLAEPFAAWRTPAALRGLATTALVLWLVAATIRSALRVPAWSTQDRFFATLTADAPTAYRAWKVAGDYWEDTGQTARAISTLKQSIALWPHDQEVYDHLGQVYRSHGDCTTAVPIFEQGLHEEADASMLRAKLVECLITVGQLDAASTYAAGGVALGQQEFKGEQLRIERARAKSDSVSPASR